MIGCDYCEEWFHPDCLSLSEEEASALTEMNWKCPVCDGTATINYEDDNQSNEMTPNCDRNAELSTSKSPSRGKNEEKVSTPNSKRTKVHVGPGEWLWLIGDQLIAPTSEEILLER